MLRSEEIQDLAAALSKAQAEMRAAEKDGENPHLRSKYPTLASVWDACREPLTKHGLAVVQTTEPGDGAGSIVLVTTLLHSSGQWISSPLPMSAGKTDPQSIGSCLTYARRYGLSAMVGVAPDDDTEDDANAASQKAPQAQQAAQAPRQGRPVAERAVQSAERQQSYAQATGAAKEDPERAKARTAFFGVYSSHFGRTSDEQRHAIVNSLLMERHKAPVETWDDWKADHFAGAARLVVRHAETCPGGDACALLHPEKEPAAEPEAAPEPEGPDETPAPDTQPAAPNGAAPAAAARCSVETCGKPLTRGQIDVSKRSFGVPMCPSCQQERRKAEAGA